MENRIGGDITGAKVDNKREPVRMENGTYKASLYTSVGNKSLDGSGCVRENLPCRDLGAATHVSSDMGTMFFYISECSTV